jgi:hypothetical protein
VVGWFIAEVVSVILNESSVLLEGVDEDEGLAQNQFYAAAWCLKTKKYCLLI